MKIHNIYNCSCAQCVNLQKIHNEGQSCSCYQCTQLPAVQMSESATRLLVAVKELSTQIRVFPTADKPDFQLPTLGELLDHFELLSDRQHMQVFAGIVNATNLRFDIENRYGICAISGCAKCNLVDCVINRDNYGCKCEYCPYEELG